MAGKKPANEYIAGVLDRVARLLEVQEANPFRIRAYRNAAQSVRSARVSLAGLVDNGRIDAIKKLPFVGEGIASNIVELVTTGRLRILDRLQGEVSPEDVFKRVPGIGEELARRIAEDLGIHSLEDLEQAAHDGRLRKIEGFGTKRLRAVRMSLAGMLSPSALRKARKRRSAEFSRTRPRVGLLLEVDEEYRRRAGAGRLRKIAPRRFNPAGEAWLPIMHTEREGWSFTALYSNTARAHELGTVKDWVVIYFETEGREGQSTVVTEKTGPLAGKRVVRGREAECRDYYLSDPGGK
jgi:DNA polymerase (family 10)